MPLQMQRAVQRSVGCKKKDVNLRMKIQVSNTENLASLYDGSGDAIDNPTQTDDNGLFDFWTTFGKYDIYVHNTKEYSVSLLNLAYFYLGVYDANPTERPDGSDLQDGDMYFNSVINHTKLYKGGNWYYADDMMNASGVAYDPASGPQTDVQTQMRAYDSHFDTIDTHLDTIDTHLDTIDTHLDNSVLNENIDIDDDTNTSDLGYTSLTIVDGGSFTIASGKTLTIDVPFSAGLYQVFSGDGSVVFGSGVVTEVYPQWWGAAGNGERDDTDAIQAALDASQYVLLPAGTYKTTARLKIHDNQVFMGQGRSVSIIHNDDTDVMGKDDSPSADNYFQVIGIGCSRTYDKTSRTTAFNFTNTNYIKCYDLGATNFYTGLLLYRDSVSYGRPGDFGGSGACWYSTFDGLYFDECCQGVWINGGVGEAINQSVNGCTFSHMVIVNWDYTWLIDGLQSSCIRYDGYGHVFRDSYIQGGYHHVWRDRVGGDNLLSGLYIESAAGLSAIYCPEGYYGNKDTISGGIVTGKHDQIGRAHV